MECQMERKIMPFSAFLLAREQMPQINLNQFKRVLKKHSVKFESFIEEVSIFKPTQYDYDLYKAKNISMSWRKDPTLVKKAFIFVSSDGFVLDGHHRYYAAINSNTPIKVYQADLPINKLLKLFMDE